MKNKKPSFFNLLLAGNRTAAAFKNGHRPLSRDLKVLGIDAEQFSVRSC